MLCGLRLEKPLCGTSDLKLLECPFEKDPSKLARERLSAAAYLSSSARRASCARQRLAGSKHFARSGASTVPFH